MVWVGEMASFVVGAEDGVDDVAEGHCGWLICGCGMGWGEVDVPASVVLERARMTADFILMVSGSM
jgi:hypothetical protein